MTRLEADKKELENVVSTVKRTAELQMDELMIHMRNMSAQNETLQSQLNDSQVGGCERKIYIPLLLSS